MGDSDDEHNAIRLFMTEETRKHNNNVSTLPGQVVTDDNNSNNDDDTVALDRIKIKMIVLKLYPTLSQLNHQLYRINNAQPNIFSGPWTKHGKYDLRGL